MFLGGLTLVTAFDLYTGERIWRTRLPIPKGVEHITADEEKISVDVRPTHFYVMNATTGEIRLSATATHVKPFFYSNHETLDFGVGGSSVWAERKQNGEQIWRQDLNIEIVQSPLLNGNTMFALFGFEPQRRKERRGKTERNSAHSVSLR